jgi:uncharacterized protein (DUF362 family)
MSEVFKTKVNNLKESIREVVKHTGGFKSFIEQGDVVLLKPNFNTSDPFPASSSPDFLQAVTELVYDAGAKMVIIGDSSTMSLNTRKVMEEIGIFDLEKEERPPRIYVFDERGWVKKKIPNSKYLKEVTVSEYLDRADKLILLPNLKTHFLAKFTGSLKLSMGFIKPFERVRFHFNLEKKIAELNKIINPDLIIMDARKCFITKGPSKGEVREPNLVLASKSRVAIDIEGIEVIQSFKGNSLKGVKARELTQIKEALNFGIN